MMFPISAERRSRPVPARCRSVRGTDLVLYISVVAMMFVLVHYYTKFVELQRKLTDMTREVAILRTDLDRVSKSNGGAP
jgi:hypothetical protein